MMQAIEIRSKMIVQMVIDIAILAFRILVYTLCSLRSSIQSFDSLA